MPGLMSSQRESCRKNCRISVDFGSRSRHSENIYDEKCHLSTVARVKRRSLRTPLSALGTILPSPRQCWPPPDGSGRCLAPKEPNVIHREGGELVAALVEGAQRFPPRGWRVCSCARRRTPVPDGRSDCACARLRGVEAADPSRSARCMSACGPPLLGPPACVTSTSSIDLLR